MDVHPSLGARLCGPILVNVAENTPVTNHRNERVLAFMVASCIGLALISVAALAIGASLNANFSTGIWPTVGLLPLVALPIAFVLMIALVIVSAIRRVRASRDA
jgi:uncharacterized membrane protein